MNIIIKPLISEKMTRLTESAAEPKLNKIQRNKNVAPKPACNRYGFIVDKRANKVEIKKAVEQLFGVKVEKVNTISVKGKKKRMGRSEGYTSDWKKAIVTLTADSKTIEFFDGMI